MYIQIYIKKICDRCDRNLQRQFWIKISTGESRWVRIINLLWLDFFPYNFLGITKFEYHSPDKLHSSFMNATKWRCRKECVNSVCPINTKETSNEKSVHVCANWTFYKWQLSQKRVVPNIFQGHVKVPQGQWNPFEGYKIQAKRK